MEESKGDSAPLIQVRARVRMRVCARCVCRRDCCEPDSAGCRTVEKRPLQADPAVVAVAVPQMCPRSNLLRTPHRYDAWCCQRHAWLLGPTLCGTVGWVLQMNVIAGLRKQISAPFVAGDGTIGGRPVASFGGSPPLPRRITESTRILRELGKVTLDIDDMPATGPEWKTIGFQVSGICGACCAWLRSVKRCGCWVATGRGPHYGHPWGWHLRPRVTCETAATVPILPRCTQWVSKRGLWRSWH